VLEPGVDEALMHIFDRQRAGVSGVAQGSEQCRKVDRTLPELGLQDAGPRLAQMHVNRQFRQRVDLVLPVAGEDEMRIVQRKPDARALDDLPRQSGGFGERAHMWLDADFRPEMTGDRVERLEAVDRSLEGLAARLAGID